MYLLDRKAENKHLDMVLEKYVMQKNQRSLDTL